MTGWRFAINQITTPDVETGAAIDLYARHGVEGIAYWVDPVRRDGGAGALARRARDAGLFAASLCTSAWMTGENRAGALDENRRRLDMAAELGAPVLVMVVGGASETHRNIALDRAEVADLLAALVPHAQACGTRIGLEPLHPMYAASRSCLNTYRQCHDLMQQLGHMAAMVPDIYHCWWDPEFLPALAATHPRRIATFHLCDWLADTRNFQDRGMVGDGVADIDGALATLAATGYDGDFELELFSSLDWWQRPAEDTVRIAMERCAPLITKHKKIRQADPEDEKPTPTKV
ncbi:MAG: sugar phosphate isomerase/epimerase family protein [Roseovarius sp.]